MRQGSGENGRFTIKARLTPLAALSRSLTVAVQAGLRLGAASCAESSSKSAIIRTAGRLEPDRSGSTAGLKHPPADAVVEGLKFVVVR